MSSLRFAVAAVALLASAACAPTTMLANRMQFSDAAVAYPDLYQEAAAGVVAQRDGDFAVVRVSRPHNLPGLTITSPQRWYSCIRGLPPRFEDRAPRLDEVVGVYVEPRVRAGIYDVVLVFDGDRRPTVKDGYDSPLCWDREYEPITADPPLT